MESFGLKKEVTRSNAFFLGLAVASFSSHSWLALVLSFVCIPPSFLVSIVLRRFLMPWNLPLLVLPYLLIVWSLWYLSQQSSLPWMHLPLATEPSTIVIPYLSSFFIGISQVFFLESELFGAILLTITLIDRRKNFLLCLTLLIFTQLLVHLLPVSSWVAKSGLALFPVFLIGLHLDSFRFPNIPMKISFLLLAPFIEILVLKAFYFLGLPALSISFLILYWWAHIL